MATNTVLNRDALGQMTIVQQPECLATSAETQVDMLILGAGWTSTFLNPILDQEELKYAATTTTGRGNTLKFKFEYDDSRPPGYEDDIEQYREMPSATTVLITFPLHRKESLQHLKELYEKTHVTKAHVILLGSTGIWQIDNQDLWITRHKKYDMNNLRAQAEDELISHGGCVLNLSGLWGGERHPKNWVDRIAPTKEKLQAKT
jgi:hypothetical protein